MQHDRNPRRGDVEAIRRSLADHGQYRPLVVQRSTRAVVAGNHSLQAARELGLEEVSVTLLDIDDEQAKQIMLVDNRTNDLASYDDRLSPGCSQSSRPRRHGLLAPRT